MGYGIRASTLAAGAALVVAGVGLSGRAQGQWALQQISGNPAGDPFTDPVGVYSAPGDFTRVYVVDKVGKSRWIDISQPNPVTQGSAAPFLNLGSAVQTPSGLNDERGFLGIAFHPQYRTNHKFYVYYSSPAVSGLPTGYGYYQNIVEYTLDLATGNADPASARTVLRVLHPSGASNHNGGSMSFGPDGYLYITTGDGGPSTGGDTGTGHTPVIGNAQDTGVLLGKILRIDVNSIGPAPQGPLWTNSTTTTVDDSFVAYGIPSDNPLLPVVANGTSPARREIWAYGVRNPWRCTFDRLTGDFWIAAVGQDHWEAIYFQPALTAGNVAQIAGRNYGWRCFEGTVSFNTNGGQCPAAYDDPSLVPPLGVYAHTTALANTNPPRLMHVAGTGANFTGCSLTGGYVYRGCRIPELYGQYLFTDYCFGVIYSTTINSGTGVLNDPTAWTQAYSGSTAVMPNIPSYTSAANNAVSFGQDSYGELYFVSQGQGRVYKLVSTHTGTIPLANADFNRDGVISVQDIFDFLASWFAVAPRADFNRDGVISVEDIFTFLQGWFGGCVG